MGRVVSATLWPLYPREGNSTHCTGGWVGPRAVHVRKISDPTKFDIRTVKPVASRYTDCAIPAHCFLWRPLKVICGTDCILW